MENQIKSWVASIIRYILSGIVGGVAAKGLITEVQAEEVVVAVIAGVTTILWSLWRKYNVSEKIRLALALPGGATPIQLDDAVAAKNDPVALKEVATEVRATRDGPTL